MSCNSPQLFVITHSAFSVSLSLALLCTLLPQVKLVDAGFIWTEPHSKRLKVKLTIQVRFNCWIVGLFITMIVYGV